VYFSGASGSQDYADIHSEDGDNYNLLKGYVSKTDDVVNVPTP